MILDVQIFMQACGHEPSHKLTSLYHDLVREEVGELEEAMAAFNASETEQEETQAKADALDAICDSIWVLIGLAKAMDLPLEAGWDAVASTNLKKIDPVLGTVRRDENGKIMKPDRWVPPDMVRLIKERNEQRKVNELPPAQEAGSD
jgi:predicted HAD superfamily Cof-like phosphohydrolase